MPQCFREVPSASINKNTWNVPVHYNSTSIKLKYHGSPPQSIFKWWHFPCGSVKVKRSSRINGGRRRPHARLAAAASSGVTFDFPPPDCFQFFFFFFLRWVLHVHSPSLVKCQDVHWCRVPGQVHRCTGAPALVGAVYLYLGKDTSCVKHFWDVLFTTKNFNNIPELQFPRKTRPA